MSTMEHLFMQIFSRKLSIEDQFKHQVDSYGENLTSNLLSEGLRPPPWLWVSRSLCPNPRELNREQLISEILDQHPWATTPANRNNSVRRSRSQGHNCQSLYPPSIMIESQGIANIAHDGSEVNELKESVNKGHANSWPKQKRNKNQSINVLHTSPRLRVDTHKHNKPVNCTGKKSSDYITEAIFESQSTMTSQNTEVHLSEAVAGSQFRVKQISKKPQTLEELLSVTAENREPSYEISPFKESDDEEGDDDYARGKKFVPSWAREESVNSNILANRHLNPYVVFSRKRSFDILKVLGPPVCGEFVQKDKNSCAVLRFWSCSSCLPRCFSGKLPASP